jgi:hypothetical protein
MIGRIGGPGVYQSRRVDQGQCLNCGTPLTGAGVLGEDAPQPSEGDIIVCLYCSHVMEVKGGRAAELSDEAIKDMAGDPEMLDTIKFTSAYQRWAKDNPP